MMSPRLLSMLTLLSLSSTVTAAVDLAKIERKIVKEPAYRSRPKYCLLVFGPEAKTRVWLVQDGDTLYVDRNGNGDLTEAGEKVQPREGTQDAHRFEAGNISDGSLTHTGLIVTQLSATAGLIGNSREWQRIKRQEGGPRLWMVQVAAERPAEDRRSLPRRIHYAISGDGRGYLLFADRPADAPIIHLNGPWSLGLQDGKQGMTAGYQSLLQIGVGTPGLGPGTFSFVLYPNTIPASAYPEADITFPPKDKEGKPVRRKYTLKQRC